MESAGTDALAVGRHDFNGGWSVRSRTTAFQELGGAAGTGWTPVTLPHDALITGERSADAPGGETNGYFRQGSYEYRRVLHVGEADADKLVYLEFDGVYRDPVVYVNGQFAGQWANGYSRFVVRIDHLLRRGADNEIRVSCRTHLDSRWYAGAGIHRDVHLLVKNQHHIAVDGVRIATTDIDADRAIADIAVGVTNASGSTETLRATVRVLSPAGEEVVTDSQPLTLWPGEDGTARFRLPVPHPQLWSADSPSLYTAIATVVAHKTTVDEVTTSFGIRTLQVDAGHGLRVNGQSVKLRGACLHADNGPLGAAAIGRAEERKVELLRAAGFNAIRSSHHPASSALLEACDRVGMYVIDETFDMWASAKTDFDYSSAFPEWWERDLDALVAKDFNHPSVIAYSIGNEIPETGSPDGGRWSRLLAGRLRTLDPHRLVTNGINGFVSVLDAVLAGMQQRRQEPTGGVNQMMADHQAMMDQIHASPMVTERTEESFAALDIAGLNYGEARYDLDHELFPNRVVVGLETYPGVIARNWALVNANPHLIGDFTWTGWDYLGETGLGLVQYPDDPNQPIKGFSAPFPGLTAWCGDLDITGHRRPMSYYREIVFGRRKQPYIAVQRPQTRHKVAIAPPWAWSDTVASWTWAGSEGATTTVEVYADADEVELRLNGEPLGRRTVGEQQAFRAEFEVTYQPGELCAIAYRDGTETGLATLCTAQAAPRLRVSSDRQELTADTRDLAFIEVALVDGDGRLCTGEDRQITVVVEGAGTLAGFGSANPVNPDRFHTGTHRAFDGRALAIVRPTGAGPITVTATTEACEPATVQLTCFAASDRSRLTPSSDLPN